MLKMKKLLILFILIQVSLLKGQTSYLIEYDKINNITSYYQCDWVKGAQTKKQIKSIKLNQNDIIIVKIINLNEFVYKTDIKQTFNIQENNNSALSSLVNIFTGGASGPALSLLNSLSGNNYSYYSRTTRGENESDPAITKCAQLVEIGDKIISSIISGITNYENAVKVKFSKTKTKLEILAELKYNQEKMKDFNADELMAKLDSVRKKLNKITESIEPNHEIWKVLDRYNERLTVFNNKFMSDDGLVKCNLIKDIKEVEKSSFTKEERFLAKNKEDSEYGDPKKYSSNEIIIKFYSENPQSPDLVKYFSIPVAHPNLPYWALSVNSVVPIGELNYFKIKNVPGDNYIPTPDSINIIQSINKGMQLSVGTQLCFEINSPKSVFTPAVCFGFAISGLNQDREDWNINFLIGSSIGLKKFPYLNFNAGISFTQTKQLKSQYTANKTFAIDPDFEYNNTTFFKKVYIPGFYFGFSVKL
jgi:hypothetical protein